MTDSYQEWFPILGERHSVNTLQGMEWILGSHFYEHSQDLIALQACPDVNCLHKWIDQKNLHIDYILLHRQRASQNLIDSLYEDGYDDLIYESPTTVIFTFHP